MGAPPHGGFAMGIERFVAQLAGEPDIRQVIAFPKVSSGSDPLTGAPTPMPEEVLRGARDHGARRRNTQARAEFGRRKRHTSGSGIAGPIDAAMTTPSPQPSLTSLPRLEDLPQTGDGTYEPEGVREAFEAFPPPRAAAAGAAARAPGGRQDGERRSDRPRRPDGRAAPDSRRGRVRRRARARRPERLGRPARAHRGRGHPPPARAAGEGARRSSATARRASASATRS